MISALTYSIMDEYEELVVAIDDPEIVKTALRIAYYSAMLDAALNDRMDHPEDQQEICAHIRGQIEEDTWKFQQLVNDKL